jgi:hypothetical protein
VKCSLCSPPEYREIVKDRRAGTTGLVVLVSDVPESTGSVLRAGVITFTRLDDEIFLIYSDVD